MKLVSACLAALLVLLLPALGEEEKGEYVPKPPCEEHKLATILLDQGKYEDAVKHFGYVIKHFDVEDPQNGEERFWLMVARLHVTAYELKQAFENGECPAEQKKLCDEWLEALFPTKARAAGAETVQTTGKYTPVRSTVEVRKLVKDASYSGAIAVGNLSSSAAELLLKWVQDGHRLLVQDGTAALFGFNVVPVPATADPRVARDRRATEHPLLEGVRPDTLLLGGANWGWCVTGHASAKPLLTFNLPAAGGQPAMPAALCAVAKSGKGDLIFCNSQFDGQIGDGGVLYRNLEVLLQTFPGMDKKAKGTEKEPAGE